MAKHRAEQASASDFDAATSALADISGDYVIDPAHTRVGFRARHAMVTTVRGFFADLEGTAHLQSASPESSSVRLRIGIASIDTGQADRDEHLRTNDFFDAKTYPDMLFASTAVEQVDDATYRVTGDLTIKAVTQPVSIDFELTGSATDVFGNTRVGFEGSLVILRSTWGLTWNAALETGGVLVSDKIQIEFDVSAVSVTAEPAETDEDGSADVEGTAVEELGDEPVAEDDPDDVPRDAPGLRPASPRDDAAAG